MPKKTVKAFTLIELLVALVIASILSGIGVVTYQSVSSSAKEKTSIINHNKIVKLVESEFSLCKVDKSAKIFNSHECDSSSSPSTNTISNYINNYLKFKNPYDNSQPIIQSNICTKGSVTISSSKTGSYSVSQALFKKKKKNTSLVSSKWSSEYKNTEKTSISFVCSASASAGSSNKTKQTIYTYKPPNDGPGAGIIVDENGNMIKGGAGTSGAHACSADCFKANSQGMKNWYTTDANGNRIYPNRAGSKYRFVMTEGPSKSGNIASSCSQGNCKYNFSNNTYTVLSTGKTYKAGESIDTRKATNP